MRQPVVSAKGFAISFKSFYCLICGCTTCSLLETGISAQETKAEAVKSVGALSAFSAGPGLALASGTIPNKRNAESKIDKRRLMSSDFYLFPCFNGISILNLVDQ